MTPGCDARLLRRARLTGRHAYARVFAQPIKSSDRYFTVLARSNDLAYPRLGLAISRKVARSAVARNRLKRIVRESFRHYQVGLGGLDVVVMGRVGLVEPDHAALAAALERHWRRLARSCAPS
ncbi:MAG: ribonuclease P protein component [Candidatus Competibacteraceae bacterium]